MTDSAHEMCEINFDAARLRKLTRDELDMEMVEVANQLLDKLLDEQNHPSRDPYDILISEAKVRAVRRLIREVAERIKG